MIQNYRLASEENFYWYLKCIEFYSTDHEERLQFLYSSLCLLDGSRHAFTQLHCTLHITHLHLQILQKV